MTTVFHAWPNGRFTEIQYKLRRKKLHRTDQGFDFLRSSFSNRYNLRAPLQFRRESQPYHLKRTHPPVFTSTASVLLDRSNEASSVFPALKSTSHFLPSPQRLVDQIQVRKPILVVAKDSNR